MSCLAGIAQACCGKAGPPQGSPQSGKWRPGNASRIHDHYEIDARGSALGEGSFGSVVKAKRRVDKRVVAIKSILKMDQRTKKEQDLAKLKNEIAIMRLMDHPNIIKLHDDFDDRETIYLVLELCTGGELFDKIVEAGHFSEVQAAIIMQQFLSSIFYMHSRRVCHRDLKPENFLFMDGSPIEKNRLKLIDFGLSCTFSPGRPLRTKAGTPYYVSPEVLAGSYDELSDVWSAGVIMYVLLCGVPPFNGNNDSQILQAVKHGKLHFAKEDGWGSISEDAKSLIRRMLNRDVAKRSIAKDALADVWIQQKAPRAPKVALSAALVGNLRQFRSLNRLKKAALHVIASLLSEDKIKNLREQFQAMDANGDGMLSVQELREGMKKAGLQELPSDLQQIIQEIDSDNSGQIDYTEFLAAALDKKHYIEKDVCWSAFCAFDKNGDGKLSRDELKLVLESEGMTGIMRDNAVDELMQEVDEDGSGEIDFDEFMRMMKKGAS